MSKFNYKWYLKDGYPAKDIKNHGKRVFTTFACGGGSTMGYKLAGYDVIAANDIDPEMRKVYVENHHPKYYFLQDIRSLLNKEYPEEFNDLDVLDGSPPCSTFSITGSREAAWGKEKKFREGQAKQTLDDLFFEFIALVKKLQPKIVIAENVKGMLGGHAKGYVKQIFKQLDEAGYNTQLFLLNASTMGVPQRRERVFFLSRRKDLKLPEITLRFNQLSIPFINVEKDLDLKLNESQKTQPTELYKKYWHEAKLGEAVGKFKTIIKINPFKSLNTITSGFDGLYHYKEVRRLTTQEFTLCGSFPLDYNFMNVRANYLIGMSVPPVMMANVADQVYKQWLSKI